MKKVMLFAVAAVALAACNSEETVSVNEGDAISFRTVVNGQTRAMDISTASLDKFNVTAINQNSGAAYFSNITFTKDAEGTFKSDKKYYWPATDALSFFAFAPAEQNNQVVPEDYKTFVVTPATDYLTQVDLIYASTTDKTKASNGASGVQLNFRHTGSKIAVKVKNSEAPAAGQTAEDPNYLDIDVWGWKIGYVSASGQFTGKDANTDGEGWLDFGDWSDLSAPAYGVQYESLFDVTKSTKEAIELPGQMNLIPQQLSAATDYDQTENPNGAFIAVKLVIKSNGTIIASEANGEPLWAIWPISTKWEPGKKYTYIIDVADGGYYEKKKEDDPELDPILDKFIKFVTVTVDDWAPNTDILVPEQ